MTIIVNIGSYGGWYCQGGRICLGWMAITFLPFDLDPILEKLIANSHIGRG